MKVLDIGPGRPETIDWHPHDQALDLMLCTRCRHPWGFEMIEKIEMWRCGHCGYEARERSVDFRRILIAQQEALIS